MERVLLITHASELGGAELALLRLVDNLSEDDRAALLVACFSEGAVAQELRSRGIEVVVTDLPARTNELTRADALKPLALLQGLVDVSSLVRRLTVIARSASIVQSASMKAHLLSLPVALLSRRPLIWYLHDRIDDQYLPQPVARIVQLLSRIPDVVVVNSVATATTVPRRSTVIYPGFDVGQAATPDQVLSRQPPQHPVFVLLGRISPTKGQKEFVRAAATVHQAHPDSRFRIVGSPMFGQRNYADETRLLADELRVPIEWVGFVDHPIAEIDGATALVHASPMPEPFGQVVMEACVRGVPVIATDAGGVAEIVGDNGYLVPPGDAQALAGAMLEVLEDPHEAARRAGRAYDHALESFRVIISAQQMSEIWHSLRGVRLPGGRATGRETS